MDTTITSYDTGSKPFKADISRGKWSSMKDFYAATFTHSFGIKSFSIVPMYAVSSFGILFIFPYALGLLILTIPIYFIQSFMGQFSSSGFISSYRIAPLFKGVGYAILAINLTSMCYSVALAAYALVYFFASFNPTLPWMTCDNAWNTHNCTVVQKYDANHTKEYEERWSSIEYFVHAVRQISVEEEPQFIVISWRLLLCVILIWIVLAAVLTQGVEFIGTLLRYFCYTILICLSLIFLRVIFVSRSYHFLLDLIIPKMDHIWHVEVIIFALILPICLYGTGGGSILTMASYNNFHSDIRWYSWMNALILLAVSIVTGIVTTIAEDYLAEEYNFKVYVYIISELHIPFIGMPFFFGSIEISNFWSMLFFAMIFLGELSGCIIQMLSICTAIFDEYEHLRSHKRLIIVGITIVLFMFSILFTTNEGTKIVQHLFNASAISLCLLSFLDIMIVVWFYGRQRFQRDVQFLLQGKMYQTWQFMILRFVTPMLILLVTLINVGVYISELYFNEMLWDILLITLLVKGFPLFFILFWISYKMKISTGGLLQRFKRMCLPTDWYPVDPGDKRRYEDVVGACSENFRDLFSNIEIEDVESDGD